MKLLKSFTDQSLGTKLAFSNQVLNKTSGDLLNGEAGGWLPAPEYRPLCLFYSLLVLLFFALVGTTDAHAQTEDVFGKWAGDGSILQISEKEGQLRAVVVALAEPVYVEGEEFGPVGAVRLDALNADESKRDTPVLGLQLLQEYQWRSGKWQGKIYDPESGKVYSSQMSVDSKGQLKMRGYIGLPMLGRTVIMQPVSTCTEKIQEMLATASLNDCMDRER